MTEPFMIATDTTYADLTAALRKTYCLSSIAGLLDWDEQVNLPPGAAGLRAEQASAMAGIVHHEATKPEVGAMLERLACIQNSLTEEQRVVVREARRDYERLARLPGEFVARRTNARSKAFHAWAAAREQNDFGSFAPHLEEQLRLAREEATYLGYTEGRAYDYHIDLHDPGMNAAVVNELFAALRERLVPLVKRILSAPERPERGLFRNFPVAGQEAFLREVTDAIGFDFERGRIDRSLHPFCSGTGDDTRMTTRFDPDNPLDSIFSAIHESGHGMYEQGLPAEHAGTPLGEPVGMAVHESQSRLWENQVSRSRGFWRYWEPRLREQFPGQLAPVDSEALYRAINAVGLNPIRCDSDEVTYNLHILLRFELEQQLFDGGLEVADLPAAWNAASEEIVGLTPSSDAEGCLQDIHWAGGAFGYFPSYTLGNMLAAQLWDAIRREMPEVESQFAQGNFGPVLAWLREHIHQHGRRYDTLELTRRVTGEELGPDALIRYLEERYGALYS